MSTAPRPPLRVASSRPLPQLTGAMALPAPGSSFLGEEVAATSLTLAVILLAYAVVSQTPPWSRRRPRTTVLANVLEPPWVFVLILAGMVAYNRYDYPSDYFEQWEQSGTSMSGGDAGKHRNYQYAGWLVKSLVLMLSWQAGGRDVWDVLSGQKRSRYLAWCTAPGSRPKPARARRPTASRQSVACPTSPAGTRTG